MEILFSKEAEDDVIDMARYISDANPAVAAEVFDMVWNTGQLLASMPEIGAPIDSLLDTSELGEEIQEILHAAPLLKGMRRFPLKKFRKLIIWYNVKGDALHIERVLHGSRDIPVIFASTFR